MILQFSDHSKPFQIYMDARSYQICATIKQDQLPIVYFSRKMTPTQRRYPTIEQKILAMVEIMKEYRNFLLGATIEIFTDCKNLLANSSTNNCVFRWKQKIEEYVPTINYVKGHTNVEADALSRLPTLENNQSIETILNHPQVDPYNPLLNKYPWDLTLINKYQRRDPALLKAEKEDPRFTYSSVYGTKLISFQIP